MHNYNNQPIRNGQSRNIIYTALQSLHTNSLTNNNDMIDNMSTSPSIFCNSRLNSEQQTLELEQKSISEMPIHPRSIPPHMQENEEQYYSSSSSDLYPFYIQKKHNQNQEQNKNLAQVQKRNENREHMLFSSDDHSYIGHTSNSNKRPLEMMDQSSEEQNGRQPKQKRKRRRIQSNITHYPLLNDISISVLESKSQSIVPESQFDINTDVKPDISVAENRESLLFPDSSDSCDKCLRTVLKKRRPKKRKAKKRGRKMKKPMKMNIKKVDEKINSDDDNLIYGGVRGGVGRRTRGYESILKKKKMQLDQLKLKTEVRGNGKEVILLD